MKLIGNTMSLFEANEKEGMFMKEIKCSNLVFKKVADVEKGGAGFID